MKHSDTYKGRYAKTPMPIGCLYLSNVGDRWVTQDMRFVLVLPDGTRKVRIADYWYSFGNFAGLSYRYQGKRYNGMPKSACGYETCTGNETGNDALPHVFHRSNRGA